MPVEVRNIEVRQHVLSLSTEDQKLCAADDVTGSVVCTGLPFQVARSLGILDEVNKMKVVPGASSVSSVNNKNVRYMGVSILSVRLGSARRKMLGWKKT